MKDSKTDEEIAEQWIEDSACMFTGVTMMFLHRDPPKRYLSEAKKGKTPVILVPGILCTWAYMKGLGDKIASLGHPVYVIPDLGYNIFDIPSSSEKLYAVIKKAEEEFGGAKKSIKVIVVAHSKGGLIGKYALIHHDKNESILRVIAIATPFSGSGMAKLVDAEPFEEIGENSEIIRELNENKEVNKKIISIMPESDNFVWSEKGSYLEGAENIIVPVFGHSKILFSREVEDVVVKKLEG